MVPVNRISLPLAAAFALLLLAGCGSEAPYVDETFTPGEAWSYHARDGEEASRVLILKVEKRGKLGVVVHVAVDGLTIANPRGGSATERTIPVISHIPMQRDALVQSVRERIDASAEVPPDWQRGYERWLGDYRERKGTIWKKPLAEVIQVIADGLLK